MSVIGHPVFPLCDSACGGFGSAAPERGRYQRHLGGDRSQRHSDHLDSGLLLADLDRTRGLGLS